jgi:hypothetical protein
MFLAPFCFARGVIFETACPHKGGDGCPFSDKILPMKRA